MPGNAQRAGGGQGLKKLLRFSCRFHVLEFMSDLSIFLMVAVYAMHNMHNMHGFTSYINLLAFIATKKLKWKPFQTFICDIWPVNDIPPTCDVDLATRTL